MADCGHSYKGLRLVVTACLGRLCMYRRRSFAHTGSCNYEAMYTSYLECFKAAALLGAAGWEGASTNDLSMFFAERFFIVVPEELEVVVFPFLPELQKRVEALGADAGPSVKASVRLFKYLAVVAIQDAAGGLALQYPQHDVHRLLNASPVFRYLLLLLLFLLHGHHAHFCTLAACGVTHGVTKLCSCCPVHSGHDLITVVTPKESLHVVLHELEARLARQPATD